MAELRLEWDSGTAYDFFASFWILQQPEEFGLRPSWAAGVRSRLPEDTRRFMAEALHFMGIPVQWIHSLPEPRDSRAVIQELERTDPASAAETLVTQCCCDDPTAREVLDRALHGGQWSASEADALGCREPAKLSAKRRQAERGRVEAWLERVSHPAEFGSLYLRGLTEFRESFFREEERRIGAALEAALRRARERATSLSVGDLLEELSQGIRLESFLDRPRLLLIPCYWCSPRIIKGCMGKDYRVILFGARPPEASLIPEDQVPASLSLALVALADTTRLNILRVLRDEPLTQAQIARKLRLRPSTISHHLKSLRIAGLIAYLDSGGADTRYATRTAQVGEVCASLGAFLKI